MSAPHARHESLPYYVSTELADFDLDRMHGWLVSTYWSPGIPRETMERAFQNSLSFGLFHDMDGQVGCARMVTDYATFAYLGDVYVDESQRGNGLGLWLMQVIMAHPDLQGLRRRMLATRDMHDLYAKVGFQPVTRPDVLMEIVDPDMYRRLVQTDG